MSICDMDFVKYITPSKILMGCGLIFLIFGYVTIFSQKPPSPIETMSFGLGLIGIAMAIK